MENEDGVPVPCSCRFYPDAPDHHDRLLAMESSGFAGVSELVEMAVTWGELEHGLDGPKIEPDEWLDFVLVHDWDDIDRVTGFVLSLASIVRRPVLRPSIATVRQLHVVPTGPGSEPRPASRSSAAAGSLA